MLSTALSATVRQSVSPLILFHTESLHCLSHFADRSGDYTNVILRAVRYTKDPCHKRYSAFTPHLDRCTIRLSSNQPAFFRSLGISFGHFSYVNSRVVFRLYPTRHSQGAQFWCVTHI